MKKTEKKTEFISFRTDQATKEALEQIAAQRKWTISLLTEEIIKEWLQAKQTEKSDS